MDVYVAKWWCLSLFSFVLPLVLFLLQIGVGKLWMLSSSIVSVPLPSGGKDLSQVEGSFWLCFFFNYWLFTLIWNYIIHILYFNCIPMDEKLGPITLQLNFFYKLHGLILLFSSFWYVSAGIIPFSSMHRPYLIEILKFGVLNHMSTFSWNHFLKTRLDPPASEG